MSKIRTTILTAAIAGGSIVGLAGVTGIADAAGADTGVVSLVGDESGGRAGEAPTAAERAERRAERVERRAERRADREADRQAVADLLGLDVAELHEQLHAGATLADVAESQGVATSEVVDLIVQQLTERIDQAVENGRITAEEAAEKIAELEERVQTRVEEGRPERGDGEGRRGPRGPGGPHGDAAVEAEG